MSSDVYIGGRLVGETDWKPDAWFPGFRFVVDERLPKNAIVAVNRAGPRPSYTCFLIVPPEGRELLSISTCDEAGNEELLWSREETEAVSEQQSALCGYRECQHLDTKHRGRETERGAACVVPGCNCLGLVVLGELPDAQQKSFLADVSSEAQARLNEADEERDERKARARSGREVHVPVKLKVGGASMAQIRWAMRELLDEKIASGRLTDDLLIGDILPPRLTATEVALSDEEDARDVRQLAEEFAFDVCQSFPRIGVRNDERTQGLRGTIVTYEQLADKLQSFLLRRVRQERRRAPAETGALVPSCSIPFETVCSEPLRITHPFEAGREEPEIPRGKVTGDLKLSRPFPSDEAEYRKTAAAMKDSHAGPLRTSAPSPLAPPEYEAQEPGEIAAAEVEALFNSGLVTYRPGKMPALDQATLTRGELVDLVARAVGGAARAFAAIAIAGENTERKLTAIRAGQVGPGTPGTFAYHVYNDLERRGLFKDDMSTFAGPRRAICDVIAMHYDLATARVSAAGVPLQGSGILSPPQAVAAFDLAAEGADEARLWFRTLDSRGDYDKAHNRLWLSPTELMDAICDGMRRVPQGKSYPRGSLKCSARLEPSAHSSAVDLIVTGPRWNFCFRIDPEITPRAAITEAISFAYSNDLEPDEWVLLLMICCEFIYEREGQRQVVFDQGLATYDAQSMIELKVAAAEIVEEAQKKFWAHGRMRTHENVLIDKLIDTARGDILKLDFERFIRKEDS